MTAQGPGEALGNSHDTGSCSPGYCLKYVRTWWEVNSLYASAIDAWNGSEHKHAGDRTPPKGAPLFYRGGNYGHIVISDPDHQGQRGTDCHGSGDVSDEDIGWVERSWGYDYLGWTEDLNGVMLPLGGEEDDMKQEDFERIRDIVKDEVRKGWDWTQANDKSRAENLNTAGKAGKKILDEGA